jgi:hypothetical protein
LRVFLFTPAFFAAAQGRDRGMTFEHMLRRLQVWLPLRRYWGKWVKVAQRETQRIERDHFRTRLAQFGDTIGAVGTHAAARRLYDVFKVRDRLGFLQGLDRQRFAAARIAAEPMASLVIAALF